MDIDSILTQYNKIESEYDNFINEINKLDEQIDETRKRKTIKSLNTKRNELESQMITSKKKLREIVSQYQSELVIVPGDETRYEQMTGYPVKVVDLGIPNKGAIIVETEGMRRYGFRESDHQTPPKLLLEHRVVGIIEAQLSQSVWSSEFHSGIERTYFGLPVKKKAE